MKLLVSSDLHLHRRLRLDDAIANLHLIEQESKQNIYDIYLITGDIFHVNRPSIIEITAFANHLRNVRAKRVLLCVGNHDKLSCDTHSLQWTSIDPRIVINSEFDVELAQNRCLFTHRTLTESKFGACNISLPGISVEDLRDYDVVISGHIHRPQILSKNPLILVPGSLFKINFGERFDKKSFYSLSLHKDKAPELLEHKLLTRNMLSIKYLIDEKQIVVNDEVVKKFESKDALIQLEIIGKKESVRKLNYNSLIKTFSDCLNLDIKITYITPETDNKIKREAQSDFTITTNTLKNKLKRYCEFNKSSKQVLKMATKILTTTQLET